MSNEERVKTPEECYQLAYTRNIAIGDMWVKEYPVPEYSTEEVYTFDFDKVAEYLYHHSTNDYNVKRFWFTRVSDNALAILTKYSHIILKR